MDKALSYLKTFLRPNDTIVIGVSTGPDSMCLLTLLKKLQSILSLKIIVAHINHQVRKESTEEENFIKDYCHQHSLICEVYHLPTMTGNFEAQAHQARYHFFQKLVSKYQAQYLMTAHHGDDLIETILMREIRGSNLKGYAGIELASDYETYKLVRPLLFYSKAEILNYLEEEHIPYYIDNTNFSDKHFRNRLRMDVLPLLKKENPKVHLKYLEYSEELLATDKFLQKFTNEIKKEVYNNNRLMIPHILKQDKVIQKRVIESILKDLYQDNIDKISNNQTKAIMELMERNNPNEVLNLPGKYHVTRNYDSLIFSVANNSSTYVPVFKELKKINNYNHQTIKEVEDSKDHSNYTIRLNSKELTLPLYVATRLPGDKISVKNMIGTKKVKEIFIDMKIPKDKRDNWLLLKDATGEVIWVPGLKKSKFDKENNEKYDIILVFAKEGE